MHDVIELLLCYDAVIMYGGNIQSTRTFTFIFHILHKIKQICKRHYKAFSIHYASHKLQATRLHIYYNNRISLVIHIPYALYFWSLLLLWNRPLLIFSTIFINIPNTFMNRISIHSWTYYDASDIIFEYYKFTFHHTI